MDIMLQRILELVDSEGRGGGTKLAAAINLPTNSVTEWRKGRKKSYIKYSAQIADYYGVTLEWLHGQSDEKYDDNSNYEKDIMLQRILELLGEKHGAAKELADAIGISPNTISNWKGGVNRSYTKYAVQIAEYYGVSLDWLSGKTDIKNSTNSSSNDEYKEYEMYVVYNKLNDEHKEAVLNIAKLLLNGQK